MRSLGSPIKWNYQNVLHWIIGERPVVEGEDDWILQTDDLVPLASVDHFEASLASSFVNVIASAPLSSPQCYTIKLTRIQKLFTSPGEDGRIRHFSQLRITVAAKLISVLLAISVLIIPILVLFLASLSKILMSATLLVSVLTFSATLCFFTQIGIQELLVGSAA